MGNEMARAMTVKILFGKLLKLVRDQHQGIISDPFYRVQYQHIKRSLRAAMGA